MTCSHCETGILDGEHRCSRCGRRVRATPIRSSTPYYPVTGAAALEPEFYTPPETPRPAEPPVSLPVGQQVLFTAPVNEPRVIAFDSLTSSAERESIRARAAAARPASIKTAKVEVRHARPRRNSDPNQRRLDFLGEEEILSQPQSNIICDAPVAPAALRMQASLVDGLFMALGMALILGIYRYVGGQLSLDKYSLPFLAAALLTIPVFYKLLWVLAGADTIGMRVSGLRLVDFDGNPPAIERRYQRFFGSFISLLAAGLGMAWAIVDEDRLTWHDHMSATFPTFLS